MGVPHARRSRTCRARLESFAPRPLDVREATLHDGHDVRIMFGERREVVERRPADEFLWVLDPPAEDPDDTRAFARRPRQERQCAHDLKLDFPLVAVRERPDEQLLVWLNSVGVLVSDLLEQVECTH
jgi:hypothetical protein